ncbi:MAG: hypothetical protein R3A47_01070 [Polyangiales bacterium]
MAIVSEGAAQDGDGLYGRYMRSVTLGLEVGGGVGESRSTKAPTIALAQRTLFFASAGPVVLATFQPKYDQRRLGVGADLRPLFPAMFFLDMSTSREFVDLMLQSLSIEVGAFFLLDGSGHAGFWAGAGFEIPLIRSARTPQRLALRLSAHRQKMQDRYLGASANADGWDALGTLIYYVGVGKHVGGWEPKRYRNR